MGLSWISVRLERSGVTVGGILGLVAFATAALVVWLIAKLGPQNEEQVCWCALDSPGDCDPKCRYRFQGWPPK